MAEFEDGRVQSLPLKGFQRLGTNRVPAATIDGVADNRAADMGEMDSHLMGAPGAESGPEKAGDRPKRGAEALFEPVLGDRLPAARFADSHALAVDRMAADCRLDGAALGRRGTPH